MSKPLGCAEFEDTICPKCGKVFLKQPFHVYVGQYKGKRRAFCSWTCFNHRNDKENNK